MSVVTNWFLGKVGQLRALPLEERNEPTVLSLPTPQKSGGISLMEALARRRSLREFSATELTREELSSLLWAADGVNRPELRERTAPSAMNAQEIDIYVALSTGLWRYAPEPHALDLVASVDARRVTGLQDFVAVAPIDLVYVADYRRMALIPEKSRATYAAACVGAISQNVYLYCAAAGLATVVRGLFDTVALTAALSLRPHQHIVLTQTVGHVAD